MKTTIPAWFCKVVLAATIALFYSGCAQMNPLETLPVATPAVILELPTSLPKPSFIISVYPEGDVRVCDYLNKTAFFEHRGIAVIIRMDVAGIADESWDSIKDENPQKVSLFVDGNLVSQDTLEIISELIPDYGPLYFFWDKNLDIGIHRIEFQIQNDAEEILTYTWYVDIKECE